MKYKTLSLIFNIIAICLFVAGIIAATSAGAPTTGLVLIPCGFIFLMTANHFQRKEKESEKEGEQQAESAIEEPTGEEPFPEEPVTTTVYAEVTDMVCGTGMVPIIGHKAPKAVRYFLLKFKTDEGKELEFEVEEEVYLGFDKGMRGNLTYFGEQIFGFEPTDE